MLPNLAALRIAPEAAPTGVNVVHDDDSSDDDGHTTKKAKKANVSQATKITWSGGETKATFATVPPNTHRSTQVERTWLREKYGEDWHGVTPEEKEGRIAEARVAKSHGIAEEVQQALETLEADVTAQFKKAHYVEETDNPKLSWPDEVLPYLQKKFPGGWQKDDGIMLSEEQKNKRSTQAKEELREQKKTELAQLLQQKLLTDVEACVARMVEELNFPNRKTERKARALCRHWFNRLGTDGKKRVWHKPPVAAASTPADVTEEMHKNRLAWARKEVEEAAYDPTNPPQPPSYLYMELDVEPPKKEDKLPDPFDAISNEGGQWLWKYMRALEKKTEEEPVISTTMSSVDDAVECWTDEFRATQKTMLKDAYGEFVESINDLSEIPGAKAVALSYTQGSGRFNKYLLWPSSNVDGDPTKIPASGAGLGGVAGNAGVGQVGPPDALHRLYKLINRCPRLPKKAMFLRSVRKGEALPHNLGKSETNPPEVGRGYINVTFMSTSAAPPEQYLHPPLSTFYNTKGGCCMYAITADKGTPVLPLVVGGGNLSTVASEQEVVFPPGLLLVYQGQRTMNVGNEDALVHFYQIASPPAVAVP